MIQWLPYKDLSLTCRCNDVKWNQESFMHKLNIYMYINFKRSKMCYNVMSNTKCYQREYIWDVVEMTFVLHLYYISLASLLSWLCTCIWLVYRSRVHLVCGWLYTNCEKAVVISPLSGRVWPLEALHAIPLKFRLWTPFQEHTW